MYMNLHVDRDKKWASFDEWSSFFTWLFFWTPTLSPSCVMWDTHKERRKKFPLNNKSISDNKWFIVTILYGIRVCALCKCIRTQYEQIFIYQLVWWWYLVLYYTTYFRIYSFFNKVAAFFLVLFIPFTPTRTCDTSGIQTIYCTHWRY